MQYLVDVRYGALKNIENFYTRVEGLKKDDVVIVRSNRGVECGEIVGEAKETDKEFKEGSPNEVLRKAGEDDQDKQKKIEEETIPEEYKYCKKKVQELAVPMKLIAIEHLFGGKKIIIYYIADKRIDFRELVKDLAREFQARIEMKQIGVRDEARLIADYQHCGRELCCRTFLKNLEPVAMRMAKRQKATMDPAKVSGRCGKLMCCLRYEDEVYEEFRGKLPKKGSYINTTKGDGEVINVEILAQCVLMETADGNKISVSLDEITGRQNRRPTSNVDKSAKCSAECKKKKVNKPNPLSEKKTT
ncbi:MAG: PSP1 domain-containing protein [Candidatus Anammoxibacter sp.]